MNVVGRESHGWMNKFNLDGEMACYIKLKRAALDVINLKMVVRMLHIYIYCNWKGANKGLTTHCGLLFWWTRATHWTFRFDNKLGAGTVYGPVCMYVVTWLRHSTILSVGLISQTDLVRCCAARGWRITSQLISLFWWIIYTGGAIGPIRSVTSRIDHCHTTVAVAAART